MVRCQRIAVLALTLTLFGWHAAASASPWGCLLTPSKVVEVGTPTTGVIKKLYVQKGQMVHAGQLLVKMRADVERANVALASARAEADADLQAAARAYEIAKRKHERNVDLERQGFVSGQAVDLSLAELQAAEAKQATAREQARYARKELGVARAELDSRTIRSPLDGYVVEVYRREGERVEDKPMLKLASVDPLHAEVVLPSALHHAVHAGESIKIQSLQAGAGPRNGAVEVVDPLVDPASNTFRVRLLVPNDDNALSAGVRCEVTLPAALERLTVSSSAPVSPGDPAREPPRAAVQAR